PGL
ncbi:hypothetical protein CFOL_v3_30019, partial [Cephalotus follicularis]